MRLASYFNNVYTLRQSVQFHRHMSLVRNLPAQQFSLCVIDTYAFITGKVSYTDFPVIHIPSGYFRTTYRREGPKCDFGHVSQGVFQSHEGSLDNERIILMGHHRRIFQRISYDTTIFQVDVYHLFGLYRQAPPQRDPAK